MHDEAIRAILDGRMPTFCRRTEREHLVNSLAYVAPDPWAMRWAVLTNDWKTLAAVARELTRLGQPLPRQFMRWFDAIEKRGPPKRRKGRPRADAESDARIARAVEYCVHELGMTRDGVFGQNSAFRKVGEVANKSPNTIRSACDRVK